MKTLTANEIGKDFELILELVLKGEEIIIKNEKSKKKIAVLLPFENYKKQKQRYFGILKDKATYYIKDDFEISDEELLNL